MVKRLNDSLTSREREREREVFLNIIVNSLAVPIRRWPVLVANVQLDEEHKWVENNSILKIKSFNVVLI